MDNEIQLISDGDGLAVIGEPTAVEKFLRSAGQWAASKELDLHRLKPLLGIGSDVVQAASEIAANSGRWIKLTEESARLLKEHGLMETKTPGVSHVMVGTPGNIQNWLQTIDILDAGAVQADVFTLRTCAPPGELATDPWDTLERNPTTHDKRAARKVAGGG